MLLFHCLSLYCCNYVTFEIIFVSDILQSRLDFAKSLGADYTLLIGKDSNEAELVRKIHEILEGHPDVSFDASGAQATVRLALLVSKIFVHFKLLSVNKLLINRSSALSTSTTFPHSKGTSERGKPT